MRSQRSQSIAGGAQSHQPGQNKTSAAAPQAPGGGEWEAGLEQTDAETRMSALHLGPEMASAGTGARGVGDQK